MRSRGDARIPGRAAPARAALARFPSGTHDELLAAHGKYYQLYTGQAELS